MCKKRLHWGLILFSVLFAVFGGCDTVPKGVFVVPEMPVPPREAPEKPAPTRAPTVNPVKTKEPLLIVVAIAEIKKDSRGVPNEFILRVGSRTAGIKRDLKGDIYNDNARTQYLGQVQLTKVQAGFSTAAVLSLKSNPDKKNAVVVFTIPQ